jgi:hypothetical protein
MKKTTWILIAVLMVVASISAAETYFGTVSILTTPNKTSNTQSVTVGVGERLRYKTASAVCSVFANTTTAKSGYPVTANTDTDIMVPITTNAVVFKCTTTAVIYTAK